MNDRCARPSDPAPPANPCAQALAPTLGAALTLLLAIGGAAASPAAAAASPASTGATSTRVVAAGADAAAAAPAVVDADATALAVTDRLVEALGGRQAWDAIRFLRFDFVGRRLHFWDKHRGRHRLEGTNGAGKPYVVLHDLADAGKAGAAWVDGEPASGAELAELLELGWGAWVNDTFWLTVPFKLRDPGLKLASAGRRTVDGEAYDVVALSYEGVGLTPGDRYWLYVDPETSLLARWEYILQDQPQEGPPTAWRWEDWQQVGGVKLSARRVNVANGRELTLGRIAAFDSLPESVFTAPAPLPATLTGAPASTPP